MLSINATAVVIFLIVWVLVHTESLSHTMVPKIALPRYEAWGDILRWNLSENVPGEFPYAVGIYPFKREGERIPRACSPARAHPSAPTAAFIT